MDHDPDANTPGSDETGPAPQPAPDPTPGEAMVLVTQVEFETLVARVEALEEALDVLVSGR